MTKGNVDKTRDAVNAAADGARDAVKKTTDVVADVAAKGSDSASEAIESATGTVKKHPVRTVLLVAVGAAVAGFIVGVATSSRA